MLFGKAIKVPHLAKKQEQCQISVQLLDEVLKILQLPAGTRQIVMLPCKQKVFAKVTKRKKNTQPTYVATHQHFAARMQLGCLFLFYLSANSPGTSSKEKVSCHSTDFLIQINILLWIFWCSLIYCRLWFVKPDFYVVKLKEKEKKTPHPQIYISMHFEEGVTILCVSLINSTEQLKKTPCGISFGRTEQFQ